MFCSKCGRKFEDGEIFCASCGNKREGVTTQTNNETNNQLNNNNKSNKKKPYWLIPTLLFLSYNVTTISNVFIDVIYAGGDGYKTIPAGLEIFMKILDYIGLLGIVLLVPGLILCIILYCKK